MSLVSPGSVILITGATGGIGFEIAAQGAKDGAVIGVHGSRPETADAAIERLKERVPDGRFIAAPGDFRDEGVIEQVIGTVASEGGRLDALIHCATAGPPKGVVANTAGPFARTDYRHFPAVVGTLLGICQQLAHVALPHLIESKGTFISFASDAGRFAAPRQTIVGASFGGIMAFVRNLAMELARDGVRAHCISPSYVLDTPIFDRFSAAAGSRALKAQERAGLGLPTPADIAPMALFLCGPGATKITGQVISINGGLHA